MQYTFVPGFGAVFSGEIVSTVARETVACIDARSSIATVHTRTETYTDSSK